MTTLNPTEGPENNYLADLMKLKAMKLKHENDMKKREGISWEDLIERLLEIFESDSINVEEVNELLGSYKSDIRDWKKFAKFDKYRYTRNLVHEGNGKFNLMLLCWAEGNQSTIHDHANAHCFVKLLDGNLRETRYHWPEEIAGPDGEMVDKEITDCKTNDVSYMSDELGLHRVENPSHSSRAVSLHLYSPPFKTCQVFDERTGKTTVAPFTFWSKFGKKVERKKYLWKNAEETAVANKDLITKAEE